MAPDDDEDSIYDIASPAAPEEEEDGVYDMASGAVLAPALRQARLDRMARPRTVENAGGGDGNKGQSNHGDALETAVSQTPNTNTLRARARSPITTPRPSKSDPTCWDPTWDY